MGSARWDVRAQLGERGAGQRWSAETEPGMTRVEIDLNVRARGDWTFSGLEDADGPVEVGDVVEVYETESGLAGLGRVEEVDMVSRLVYLSVDWSALHVG